MCDLNFSKQTQNKLKCAFQMYLSQSWWTQISLLKMVFRHLLWMGWNYGQRSKHFLLSKKWKHSWDAKYGILCRSQHTQSLLTHEDPSANAIICTSTAKSSGFLKFSGVYMGIYLSKGWINPLDQICIQECGLVLLLTCIQTHSLTVGTKPLENLKYPCSLQVKFE